MAAINPQTLLGESACFNCYGEVPIAQALKLALLARTLKSLVPTADTSAAALLTYASCYNCYADGNPGDLMEMALLDQISQAV